MSKVLPKGWVERLMARADLEHSYQELDGCEHFHAETMRGRIRTLQLRFEDARNHFDRSQELKDDYEETKDNLRRQFLLWIYRFDNALLEQPVDPDVEVDNLVFPPVDRPIVIAGKVIDLPSLLRLHKDVKAAVDQKKHCEALLYLHLGHSQEAREIILSLIRGNPDGQPAQLAGYYTDLAACLYNLDREDEADEQLQNAELATGLIADALPAGMVTAGLIGTYTFLGRKRAAKEWRAYLRTYVKCPRATRDVLLKRARLLVDRCLEHSRLVAF